MRPRGLQLIVPLLILALAAGLRLGASDVTEKFFLFTSDLYQRWAPRTYEKMPVRIVRIDDASLAEFGQWPWPRPLIARLVDRLTEAGAAAIGFDMVFAEPDRTSPKVLLPTLQRAGEDVSRVAPLLKGLPDYDAALAEAIGRSNVVVGEILQDGTGTSRSAPKAGFSFAGDDPVAFVPAFSGVIANLPELEGAAHGVGFLNHDPEWDRLLRRVPLLMTVTDPATGKRTVHYSLAAELLRLAQGARSYIAKGAGASGETSFGRNTGMVALRIGRIDVPTDAEGRVWLHYTPPEAAAERYVSAKDVLDGRFDRDAVEGQIVLIGATFAGSGSQDLVATPLSPVMPGVEVHAQLLEEMLQGSFLTRPDLAEHGETVLMILVALALVVLIPRLGAIAGAGLAAAALAAAFGFSGYAFVAWRMMLDPVYPAIVVILVYGAASLVGYMRTEAEQREIRNAFSRYMSPVLVNELARHPEKLKLGGEMKTMSVMFCDIRGFTTISEGLDAIELTAYINRFLTPMTEIILEHKGTIDKYIGDCIMAFWNAPLDDPDHAKNAVRAAQAMRRRLAELNGEWEKEALAAGRPFKPLKIGIGVNSGEICVGNMGSDLKFNYSVLGDAVNLASRLEGLGKVYGVDFVLGETTAAAIGEWPLIELDLVAVKGKSRAVQIFTLLPDAEEAQPLPMAQHRALLAAYRQQDWATATRIIEEGIAERTRELSAVYSLYQHRIEEFRQAPPQEDWDGVYVAKEK